MGEGWRSAYSSLHQLLEDFDGSLRAVHCTGSGYVLEADRHVELIDIRVSLVIYREQFRRKAGAERVTHAELSIDDDSHAV
jgi:hypothetical protein